MNSSFLHYFITLIIKFYSLVPNQFIKINLLIAFICPEQPHGHETPVTVGTNATRLEEMALSKASQEMECLLF